MTSTLLVDQATQLRSLVRQTRAVRRRASVVAITSGKGGVGKSNVAVNLAITLSAAGKKVVLLDADLGLANADVLCGLDLPSNLSHVISRKRELSDVMVRAPGGFSLVGGASGLARMADLSPRDRQHLVESLGELEEEADLILIDTGAGISPNVLTFTQAADHVLVVTTPEPTAITDAYAVVKVIARSDGVSPDRSDRLGLDDASGRKMSLLVNQARSAAEGRVVYERIARVAQQFLNTTLYDAGYVPVDPHVPACVRRRTPFVLTHPRCAASASISQLAMKLAAGVTPTGQGGFFQRMGKWFKR